MTKEEAQAIIMKVVSEKQGCKALELVAAPEMGELLVEHAFIPLIEEMVEEGLVVEVEYSLPPQVLGANRTKSFYFPRGTEVFLV